MNAYMDLLALLLIICEFRFSIPDSSTSIKCYWVCS